MPKHARIGKSTSGKTRKASGADTRDDGCRRLGRNHWRNGATAVRFMARKRRASRDSQAITWDTVRDLVNSLPRSEEGTSYGTPAFKVAGKLFVRLHDSGHSIVVRIEMTERATRIQSDPDACYITDHYRAYPWMLVRLSAVRLDDLADLLEGAWRLRAPKRLLGEYDAEWL